MDKNAHYLMVGLFVILATIAGIFFAGWLYNDSSDHQTRRYEIHFSESVDGLNAGNEVRYMGIKVGQVEATYLIPEEPGKVRVIIRIEETTPVFSNTVATLRTQGVTGLSYINLVARQASKTQPVTRDLPINTQSELPIIHSAPSEFGGLIQALPKLHSDLNTLINNANLALSQQNLKSFSSILEHIDQLAINANKVFSERNVKHLSTLLENLDQAAAAAPQLVADLRQTSEKLNHLVSNMDDLVGQNKAGIKTSVEALHRTLNNVSVMTQRYSQLAEQLRQMTATNEASVSELFATGGSDLKQLLIESRRTATAIRRLSEKLEQNPSQILYEPETQGVEIPY